MNDHQKKLYDLLLTTDEIFKEHEIQYYLSGGGALGAVRHRGFLPWDDDVDLYLFRWEYEKLLTIRDQLEEADLFLCDSHLYQWYDDTLPRLSTRDSAMLTKSRIVDETANGYFMEIFILDPIPRDPEAKEEWLMKHWLYSELLKDAYIVANSRVYDQTDEIYFEYRKRFETEGRENVLAELEQDLFTIEPEVADECCSRWGMRNAVYDMDWLGEPRYMLFEDAMLPVPNQVEKFLRADFGDSWVMVPEEDGQGTWHNIASNDHISYQVYVDDYMQFIDADEIHRNYIPRKHHRMQLYFDDKKATPQLQELKIALVKQHYEKLGESEETLQKWEEEKDYESLDRYFRMWKRTQFSGLFRLLERYVDVGDENLYYALLPMFERGQQQQARDILEWRQRLGSMEGRIRALYDYLKNISDAQQAIYENDFYASAAYLKEAKESGSAVKIFQESYIQLYLEVHGNLAAGEDHDTYVELIRLLMENPDEPQIICLLADIEFKRDDLKKAEALYEMARADNRNGMLLLHIQDQIEKIQGVNGGGKRE